MSVAGAPWEGGSTSEPVQRSPAGAGSRRLPERGPLVAIAVAGLLTIVALSTGGDRGLVGRSGGSQTREAPRGLVDYLVTIALVAAAAIVVLLVYVILTVRGPRAPRSRARTLANLLTFLLLLAAISLFMSKGHELPFVKRLQQDPAARAPGPQGTTTARPTPGSYQPEFKWIVPIVLGSLGAGAALFVLIGRRRARAEEETSVGEALADVLAETVADLRAEGDPRRAIIAAYARMERALAAHGIPRRASEAPHEYLARVLRELEASPEPVAVLTRLFERAKFSHHRLDVTMKDEALDALETVRDELRAAA